MISLPSAFLAPAIAMAALYEVVNMVIISIRQVRGRQATRADCSLDNHAARTVFAVSMVPTLLKEPL
jgi:hypothetical protein